MITLTPVQLVAGLVVIAIAVAVMVTLMRRRHTAVLRERYGTEYDHTLRTAGDADKAEALLHEREKRVAAFHIRSLSGEQRTMFIGDWRRVQALFVDDPEGALARADVLLGQVMETRGYPVSDFEQRSADLSVDHGHVVEHYRTAHTVTLRHARGQATTEDMRQAMIHYRALFDDLVNEPVGNSPAIAHREGRVLDLRREPVRRP